MHSCRYRVSDFDWFGVPFALTGVQRHLGQHMIQLLGFAQPDQRFAYAVISNFRVSVFSLGLRRGEGGAGAMYVSSAQVNVTAPTSVEGVGALNFDHFLQAVLVHRRFFLRGLTPSRVANCRASVSRFLRC